MSKHWVLLGGGGFIGCHLARMLLENTSNRVTMVDIQPAYKSKLAARLLDRYPDRLNYRIGDVRDFRNLAALITEADVLVNLAAVHREPGHSPGEYHETNVAGAVNIVALAEDIDCKTQVFISSISVYGPRDEPADETTMPAPVSHYGKSKLEAEHVHRAWLRGAKDKYLLIIRPGVVFGDGEGGNVNRLLETSIRINRGITIRPDIRKSSIYVKELCRIVLWACQKPSEYGEVLYNGVGKGCNTFNSFAETLISQGRVSKKMSVPRWLIQILAGGLKPFRALFSSKFLLHPVRIAKIITPNPIESKHLPRDGYEFRWNAGSALADFLFTRGKK